MKQIDDEKFMLIVREADECRVLAEEIYHEVGNEDSIELMHRIKRIIELLDEVKC